MDSGKRFSWFLAGTLIIFEGISLSLVVGILYGILSTSFAEEHRNKLQAKQAEMCMALRDRVNFLETRIKELGLDNTVRVSLMLGLDSQLRETMERKYPCSNGAYFFIKGYENGFFIPELPAELAPLAPRLTILSNETEEGHVPFCKIGPGAVGSIASMPVRRRGERIGTAYMVYDLSKDERLWMRLGTHSRPRLVLKDSDLFIDLLASTASPVAAGRTDERFMPMKDFPGLFYGASSEPLMKKKRDLIFLLSALCTAIFLLTLLVSFLIARRMSVPLEKMADQALRIAGEPSRRFLREKEIYYLEFRKLAQAFNHVLRNLLDAQDSLEKRAKRELEASEQRYRRTLEAAPDAITISGLETGRYLLVNEGFTRISGFSSDEVLGKTHFALDLIVDLVKWRHALEVLSRHGEINGQEIRIRRKDGGIVDTLFSARLIQFGEEDCLVSVVTEISGLKRAEEALRESEEKHRTVVESLPFAFMVIQDDAIVFANSTAARELRVPRAGDLLGENPRLFVHGRERARLKNLIDTNGDDAHQSKHLETNLCRTDGELLPVEVFIAPTTFKGKPAAQLTIMDISEKKRAESERIRLEAQLRHSHKMEAVGTLAGGIAHDFNNLLQAIGGYSDLLLLGKNQGEPGYRELTEIANAVQRASELTQQLLTFSRKVVSKLRPVDLNHEVNQVHKLLNRTIPKMIDIKLVLSDDLKIINADPVQMEQVMMNLAVNARDAMPEGGTLTIETSNVTLGPHSSNRPSEIRAGEYVLLRVSDTGCGIRPDTLEHIFEPFFSTKMPGKGTGLGLSSVYGIVRNHGGSIQCSSRQEKGTSFRIVLPVLHGNRTASRPDREQVSPSGNNETILLTDDESFIRDFGTQVLTKFGYRVLTAASGEDALALYHEKSREIDLVILDVIMPGMGGKKCLEELLKVNPGLRVLVASGYPIDEPWRRTLDTETRGFIRKPYEVRHMLEKVRSLLDNSFPFSS